MEDNTSRSVSKSTIHTCTQPTKVIYSITYAVAGQVGFYVPQISENSEYRQRLLTLLQAEPWVISEQINPIVGSVVITYMPGVMSDLEMRWHLISLLQAASDAEVAVEQTSTEPAISKSEPELVTHPQEARQLAQQPASEPELVTHPQEARQLAQQTTKVAYNIVHAIPGRVRFRVPQIASDPKYVQRLEALLKEDPVVTSERVNRDAISIVITYKTGMLQDSKKQVQSVLETAASHLASLIESASDVTVGMASENAS
ncbi:hypothetical protein GS682_23795 [Nostoc sp. B(2019)]|nr:hypothetical protein [Nostoc sp. B(2019)]